MSNFTPLINRILKADSYGSEYVSVIGIIAIIIIIRCSAMGRWKLGE